jgi:mannosyltransferase
VIVDVAKSKQAAAPVESASGGHKTVLWLCFAAFLMAWLPRMHWGFWTDEAGTFWMASQGWHAAISRTETWPGQSLLYSVLQSFFVTTGYLREPLLRVPSLIAMAIAAWQLKRLADIVIGKNAGWFAVVPFICAPDVTNFATSARPYALALAASLASFRYLFEWRQSSTRANAVKYLATSVLTLYLHYIFGFVFVIQGAYLLFCKLRGQKIPWGLPLTATIVLPLSVLPVIRSLTSTVKSADFSHAAPPSFMQLLQLCFPPVLLLAAALGAVLLLVSGRSAKWKAVQLKAETWFLLATWLLVAPIVFFLVSTFTSQTVFAARYLLFSLPAFVLLLTWLLAGLDRKQSQLFVLAGVFGGAILHPGVLLQNFMSSPSSWREPIEFVAAAKGASDAPVFITSGLANSSAANWQELNPATDRFFSQLTAYPIANPAVPLPYEFGDHVKSFVEAKKLENTTQFLIAAADSELVPWMSDYMKQHGFGVEMHPFSDYVVVQFHK